QMQVFGNSVRFGVQLTTSRNSYAEYLANWQACEALGYDVAYVTDHLALSAPDGKALSVLESTTLLAAMAAQSERIRWRFMPRGTPLRPPAGPATPPPPLAGIPGGRLELGIGAGNGEGEHGMYGVPFPPAAKRMGMLRESLAVLRSLLTNDRTD